MAVPATPELQTAARKLVHQAKKDNTLHSLTPRVIRQELEKKFSLDAGTLDTQEYKQALKATITAAVEEESKEETPKKATKKRKSAETSEVKTKSKPAPKPKSATAQTKTESKPQPRKRKSDVKEFKSAATIPTSDAEPDEDVAVGRESDAEDDLFGEDPPPKRRKISLDAHTSPKTKPIKPAPPSKSKRASEPPEASTSKVSLDAEAADEKSESELSVLIDEPPKHKRKSKNATSTKKPAKEKKTKKPAVELSKDEETIKRLKSFVVACGVRKVWSKVFVDAPEPSQQIKILKSILTDLGMSGRMSLEQAKAIKEKRELAQELADVQSFEQSVKKQSSRAADKNKKRGKQESESEGDEEKEDDEDLEEMPVKRKSNARQSIMAFLGDLNDSDED